MCRPQCRRLPGTQATRRPTFQNSYLHIICHCHPEGDRDEGQEYAVGLGRLEKLRHFRMPFEDHLPPARVGLRSPNFSIVELHELVEIVELVALLFGDLALVAKEVDWGDFGLFAIGFCHSTLIQIFIFLVQVFHE